MRPSDELDGGGGAGQTQGVESIREHQRRRRDAGRTQSDLQAILAGPQEEQEVEEEEGEAPAGAPPLRVFVVFHGAKWDDPEGGLRESDTIAGVYATEESARRAVATISRDNGGGQDAWYQPYTVQD
ncbi:MAG TPA: hypothetical protein VHS99_19185 [Chloroflexota bacterium]|nr:hypothetical protein [Chloroflexota bacterium]